MLTLKGSPDRRRYPRKKKQSSSLPKKICHYESHFPSSVLCFPYDVYQVERSLVQIFLHRKQLEYRNYPSVETTSRDAEGVSFKDDGGAWESRQTETSENTSSTSAKVCIIPTVPLHPVP